MEFSQFTITDYNTWLEVNISTGALLIRKSQIYAIAIDKLVTKVSINIMDHESSIILPCNDASETTTVYNYLRNIL